jgi:hypothetical protein
MWNLALSNCHGPTPPEIWTCATLEYVTKYKQSRAAFGPHRLRLFTRARDGVPTKPQLSDPNSNHPMYLVAQLSLLFTFLVSSAFAHGNGMHGPGNGHEYGQYDSLSPFYHWR